MLAKSTRKVAFMKFVVWRLKSIRHRSSCRWLHAGAAAPAGGESAAHHKKI